ncbi:MAG: TIM barrel protein [Candidatus Aminicenantes bacterium]|nr:TIM barrel protein [Candidatus Aminicenantes bacterium]
MGGAAASLAALAANPLTAGIPGRSSGTDKTIFKLKYAPYFGMFKAHAGKDPIDQLKFMADHGFSAVFDNGLMKKPAPLQESIARELERLNMGLGPFVAYADFSKESFVTRDKDVRQMLAKTMKKAVETAERVNAKWTLVVPGRYGQKLEWDYQTANVIDNLKLCVDICEPTGLVIVIEPLNRWNHPGLFLTGIPQAYQICKAVNSPNCKIVNDLYHQQISEGNLIPNIDRAWDEIASFHLGDNPGRNEPTTGEINFKNIFKHIHGKGYKGILCMEHGKSLPGKQGEKALIAAYRACDDF